MKKTRFTETQIVAILQKQETTGAKVSDICREHGISDATFYNWKAKYGGMESSEVARLRAIEDENARMKRIIANLSLENDAMKELIAKNSWGPRSEKPR